MKLKFHILHDKNQNCYCVCSPNYWGGWSRRITWAEEFKSNSGNIMGDTHTHIHTKKEKRRKRIRMDFREWKDSCCVRAEGSVMTRARGSWRNKVAPQWKQRRSVYIHLLDRLSTAFLPVFRVSLPECCNFDWFCWWSLDNLPPFLLPFTTMFLESPNHFIPTDSLTQEHLVTLFR